MISTLKKLIPNSFSKKDARLITLNEFNTFWLETPAKERNSSELTIAALPHLTSLKDSTTSSIVDDQAEFDHIMRIILELEDQDEIMQLFKRLNLTSMREILSMSYEELWSLSFTPSNSKDSLCLERGDILLIE